MKLFPTKWYPPPPEPPAAEQVIEDEKLWQSKWRQVAELAWSKGLYLCSCIQWRRFAKSKPKPFQWAMWHKVTLFAVVYSAVLGLTVQPEYLAPILLWTASFGLLFLLFAAVVTVHPMRQPSTGLPYPPNKLARVTRGIFALFWYSWLGWLAWKLASALIEFVGTL